MANNTSYTKIARLFIEKHKDQIAVKKNYIDGKALVFLIYKYIMETDDPSSAYIKQMFEKYHISKEFMYKTIKKMFAETGKNFVIGNKVFLPAFGYYGVSVLKNKKTFSHYHIYISHFTVTNKRNRYKAVIVPEYNTYYQMIKNLKKKAAYR